MALSLNGARCFIESLSCSCGPVHLSISTQPQKLAWRLNLAHELLAGEQVGGCARGEVEGKEEQRKCEDGGF